MVSNSRRRREVRSAAVIAAENWSVSSASRVISWWLKSRSRRSEERHPGEPAVGAHGHTKDRLDALVEDDRVDDVGVLFIGQVVAGPAGHHGLGDLPAQGRVPCPAGWCRTRAGRARRHPHIGVAALAVEQHHIRQVSAHATSARDRRVLLVADEARPAGAGVHARLHTQFTALVANSPADSARSMARPVPGPARRRGRSCPSSTTSSTARISSGASAPPVSRSTPRPGESAALSRVRGTPPASVP